MFRLVSASIVVGLIAAASLQFFVFDWPVTGILVGVIVVPVVGGLLWVADSTLLAVLSGGKDGVRFASRADRAILAPIFVIATVGTAAGLTYGVGVMVRTADIDYMARSAMTKLHVGMPLDDAVRAMIASRGFAHHRPCGIQGSVRGVESVHLFFYGAASRRDGTVVILHSQAPPGSEPVTDYKLVDSLWPCAHEL